MPFNSGFCARRKNQVETRQTIRPHGALDSNGAGSIPRRNMPQKASAPLVERLPWSPDPLVGRARPAKQPDNTMPGVSVKTDIKLMRTAPPPYLLPQGQGRPGRLGLKCMAAVVDNGPRRVEQGAGLEPLHQEVTREEKNADPRHMRIGVAFLPTSVEPHGSSGQPPPVPQGAKYSESIFITDRAGGQRGFLKVEGGSVPRTRSNCDMSVKGKHSEGHTAFCGCPSIPGGGSNDRAGCLRSVAAQASVT